ncbi:MAG: lysostaphin resistance A-like protein [Planctomycetota bacterium]
MSENDIQQSEQDAISVSNGPWSIAQNAFKLHIYVMLGWLAALFVCKSVVADWSQDADLQSSLPYGAPQIAVMAVFTLLLLVFIKLFKQGEFSQLGFRTEGISGDLKVVAKWAMILGGFYVLLGVLAWLAAPWFVDNPDVSLKSWTRSFMFKRYDLGTALAVIIAFPVLEEIWFRGLLYTGARKNLGRNWAIVMSALIFAFAHGSAVPANQFLGGLVFAWAYEQRRGLIAPVLLHMLGNGALYGVGLLALKLEYVSI